MTFEVLMTRSVVLRIREQVDFIAKVQGAPETAELWLRRILGVIDGLAELPRRYRRSELDRHVEYEVRHVSIGQFVLQFTILEDKGQVWVIHARHGKQLSGPDTLPRSLEGLKDELGHDPE